MGATSPSPAGDDPPPGRGGAGPCRGPRAPRGLPGGWPGGLGALAAPPPAYGEALGVPGGLLVPPGHVGALAAAPERADALPPPGPLAVAGAARHRPEAVAQHHLALYRSLVRR